MFYSFNFRFFFFLCFIFGKRKTWILCILTLIQNDSFETIAYFKWRYRTGPHGIVKMLLVWLNENSSFSSFCYFNGWMRNITFVTVCKFAFLFFSFKSKVLFFFSKISRVEVTSRTKEHKKTNQQKQELYAIV